MKKIFSYLIVGAITLFAACTPNNTPDDPTNSTNPNDTIASGNTGQTNEGKMVAVDLGLSVKWATCNVGANKPSEYGSYFAWGEVEPKNSYTEDNYKWFKKVYSGRQFIGYQATKYTETDGLKVLINIHDAAAVHWGDKWRMPTREEMEELENNCIWEMAFNNGVKGWKVIGPSGKSIFFPTAGYYEGSFINANGNSGKYWSSTVEDNEWAIIFTFTNGMTGVGTYIEYRERGLPVRPVCPKE